MKKPRHPKSPSGLIFYESFPPTEPTKPSYVLAGGVTVHTWEMGNYDSMSMEDLKPLIDLVEQKQDFSLYIESDDGDYGEASICVTLRLEQEAENPNYSRELAAYKIELDIYEEDVAWWKACKKASDEYKKAQKLEAERKQYERLKKKFDKEESS